MLHHGFALEEILPCVTSNSARVLQLKGKGRLRVGMDADVLLVDPDSLEITDVFARGTPMVRDGKVVRPDSFLHDSDRCIQLVGENNRSCSQVAVGRS